MTIADDIQVLITNTELRIYSYFGERCNMRPAHRVAGLVTSTLINWVVGNKKSSIAPVWGAAGSRPPSR